MQVPFIFAKQWRGKVKENLDERVFRTGREKMGAQYNKQEDRNTKAIFDN